jgi:hypothetical protein
MKKHFRININCVTNIFFKFSASPVQRNVYLNKVSLIDM